MYADRPMMKVFETPRRDPRFHLNFKVNYQVLKRVDDIFEFWNLLYHYTVYLMYDRFYSVVHALLNIL